MPVFRILPLALALTGVLAAAGARPEPDNAVRGARDYDATGRRRGPQYDASLGARGAGQGRHPASVGLSAGASRTEIDADTPSGSDSRGFNTQTAGINAVQPIYRPANWVTYEQASGQVDIAQTQLTIAEQDLVVRVSQAYFDVLASQTPGAGARAESRVAEQLAAAKRNFEVGTRPSPIRAKRGTLRPGDAQEIAAENDLQVKKIVLDQLVGARAACLFRWPRRCVAVNLAGRRERWVAQAEDVHPAIAQARLAVDVATLEIDKAKAGHKPTLARSWATTCRTTRKARPATGKTRVNAASIGVQFSLPLFAGFATENRIRETLALEEQSKQVLESTRRSVTQATRSAYRPGVGAGQVKALEAAEASRQSALDANRWATRSACASTSMCSIRRTQLFQTRRDLAVARYNVLLGNLKLRQANGTLTAGDGAS